VNEPQNFRPERNPGLVFLAAATVLLVIMGGWGIWKASIAVIGPEFLLALAPVILALALGPWVGYRFYALLMAYYVVERDGLRLHWGLRAEVVPMDTVKWIRPAKDMDITIPLPRLYLPGSILGRRRIPEYGEIEFLASTADNLILIATAERIFAISPDDTQGFLQAYRRFTELGSLTPLAAQSVYLTFLLARVWDDHIARYLLLVDIVLSLALLVSVSLAIPSRQQVTLGINLSGALRDLVPSIQLFLLPVLNAFFLIANLAAGLYFYRRDENRNLAYLIWGCGVVTPALFMAGVLFILQAS
jgi:hypothetical protein